MEKELLSIWTVYRHPSDLNAGYAARRWIVGGGPEPIPTDDVRLAETLEALRDQLPPGLYPMDRAAEDDPCIVETWF